MYKGAAQADVITAAVNVIIMSHLSHSFLEHTRVYFVYEYIVYILYVDLCKCRWKKIRV